MDKEIVDKLREQKNKKGEMKRSRKVEGTQFTQAKQTTQRRIEKEDRTKFNEAWFVISIRATGERFHNNFGARY